MWQDCSYQKRGEHKDRMTAKKTQKKSEKDQNQTAFIISPIGNDATEARKKVDGLVEIIAPVLKEFNLEPLAAHQISKSGSINKQVIEHLLNDKLVICNLTNLNPNVMYELGVRHSSMLPTVLIAEKDTKNPFDVFDMRTIPYEDSFNGVQNLQEKLRLTIKETLDADSQDNPVSSVIGFDSIIKATEASGDDAQTYIIEQINNIQKKLNNIPIKNSVSSVSDASQKEALFYEVTGVKGRRNAVTSQIHNALGSHVGDIRVFITHIGEDRISLQIENYDSEDKVETILRYLMKEIKINLQKILR